MHEDILSQKGTTPQTVLGPCKELILSALYKNYVVESIEAIHLPLGENES